MRFAVGDEVFGMPGFPDLAGGYAEYVAGPARHFAAKPETLDHVQAAALPLSATVAWQALVQTARIGEGDRVLVHAAAGGVGHLAVQIAKARGAYVIGTARAVNHDMLRELGADELIDHTCVDFAEPDPRHRHRPRPRRRRLRGTLAGHAAPRGPAHRGDQPNGGTRSR